MENNKTDFEIQIDDLVNQYGKLEFFEQALEKRKVTRYMIHRAKYVNMYKTLFFYIMSTGVIFLGLAGFLDLQPKEICFLIPFGVVMFCAVHNHSRKVKMAVNNLAKLATGIHAKKLAK